MYEKSRYQIHPFRQIKNHFFYLLLLFGWRAQTPGGQVGPTLLIPDRGLIFRNAEGLYMKYSKDQSVYEGRRGDGTFTICSPKSRLRAIVLKTVLI